jgi:staphylococcal nuclease domain-containing protein 1
MAQQQQQQKQQGWGRIKHVLSGDTIVVQLATRPGDAPQERELILSSLNAPRLGRRGRRGQNDGKPDEPFAWQSREHLRELCIGKKIRFVVEHKVETSGRLYSQVYLSADPSAGQQHEINVGVEMARAGWVRVRQLGGKRRDGDDAYAEALAAGMEAEQAEIGVFGDVAASPIGGGSAQRDMIVQFDSLDLLTSRRGKPQKMVVEQVRDGTTLCGWLLPDFHWITLRVAGAQSPSIPYDPRERKELPAEPFYNEAKQFAEMVLLGREADVTFTGIDTSPCTLFGSIGRSGHDLGAELIGQGMARFVDWNAIGNSVRNTYRAAEHAAKQRRMRIWSIVGAIEASSSAAAAASSSSSAAASADSSSATPSLSFEGVVREVRGNGELVLRRADNNELRQVSISSVVVPRMGRTRDQDEPWAWEVQTLLRSKLRGRTVQASFDYEREPTNPAHKPRTYFSIFLNRQNVAELLLDRGLAKIINHRTNEARSQHYANLLIADGKAKKASRGMHGNLKKAPKHQLTDLTQRGGPVTPADSKSQQQKGGKDAAPLSAADAQKKQVAAALRYQPFLQRAGRQAAVVEYCYSSDRYKIYVPRESVIINFTLTGVRCPRSNAGKKKLPAAAVADGADAASSSSSSSPPPPPSPSPSPSPADELQSQNAVGALILEYVRDNLHQMDVDIQVESIDKIGTFIGYLWLRKHNFATTLLEQGYAQMHAASAQRSTYANDYREAEERAKAGRRGVWANYDPEAEAAAAAARQAALEAANADGSSSAAAAPAQQDWMRVQVTEVIDGGWFFIQIVGEQLSALTALMAEINAVDYSAMPVSTTFAPKRNDVVLAHFAADNQWYRAKVAGHQDGRYQIVFIDYGNASQVAKSALRPIPEQFARLAPQAHECVLAYVRPPALESDYGDDAAVAFKQLVWGKTMLANIEYRDQQKIFVTLGDPASNSLVNSAMVQAGFAFAEQPPRNRQSAHIRTLVDSLQKEQENALAARRGMWQYGYWSDRDDE